MNTKACVFSTLICIGSFVSQAFAQDQAPRFGLGMKYLDPAQYQSIPLAAPPLRGELPKSVDLADDFPEPGNQGQQGSCVAWAVAYGMKSFQEHKERGWSLDDEDHLFSPAALYNAIKLDNGCEGGSYLAQAFEFLMSVGDVPLSSFPYDDAQCDRRMSSNQMSEASQYRIASTRTVNVQSPTEVKSHLAAGFPVVIGMDVYDNFQSLGSDVYTGPTGQLLGGHAMVIIGYDDNIGAFKLLNSWGTNWGDGGYGHISYDAFRRLVHEAYVSQDIVASQPEDDNKTDETFSTSLRDGFKWYGESGYNFDEHEIVSWNAANGDILAAKRDEDSHPSLFLPFDTPPYNADQDTFAQAGILKLDTSSLGNVQHCPIVGYAYHWYAVVTGDVFCVRTRSGEHYVALQISAASDNSVAFRWKTMN